MVQFLQRTQKNPSFSEVIGRGLGTGLGEGIQKEFDFANEASLLKKKQEAKNKLADTGKFARGLETVGKLREVVDRGNVGRLSGLWGYLDDDTAHDRGELQFLGNSLVSLVSEGIPIRNQKEFEQYSKIITDPSSNPEEIRGALDAIEKVFKGKLEGETGEKSGTSSKDQGFVNVRSPNGKIKKIPRKNLAAALEAGGVEE